MSIERGGSMETEPTKEIMPDSKIGLSVSFCIADMIRGKVAEEEVKEIIAGTTAKTSEEWDGVIEQYKKSYWQDNPEMGEEICRRFLDAGKISQPMLEGKDHNIADGYWLEADQTEEE